MNIIECEILVEGLEDKLKYVDETNNKERKRIENEINKIRKEAYTDLKAWDRVLIARNTKRPKAFDYINALIDDFIELHGDYYFGDDESIIGGIGYFNKMPVTVLAQAKGRSIEENIKRNFGSNNPEGFRKTLRLAKEAEKFNRPIITIVDTSGAYPGRGAEERGQSRAIANNLLEFSKLSVPVIAIVIGEGGSGGALALSVANKILMLENAVYSILSPEGFSSILFKDTTKIKEAAQMMELTASDLYNKKIVDYIISEPLGGAQNNFRKVIENIDKILNIELNNLSKLSNEEIINTRYQKFRNIGII